MNTVTILRDLWRLRLLVIAAALLALLAGTALVYKISFPPSLESRKYEIGLATARILVDTPSSQVVEVAPKGSESLGVRANLLASLMVDGVVEEAIAKRAGLAADKLVGVTETATEPAPAAKPPSRRAFVLTTRVVANTSGEQLPIIELEAQAPTQEAAAALAAAAVSGLRDYLDSRAALQQVPNADRLQVTGLGAPVASTVARGPSNMIAVVVVIFVFGFGCATILGVRALVRGWRDANVREQGGGADVVVLSEVAAPAPAPTAPVEEPAPRRRTAEEPAPRRRTVEDPAPRRRTWPRAAPSGPARQASPPPGDDWLAPPPPPPPPPPPSRAKSA